LFDKEEIIDEVLVMIMKGPKTFTREDIVEINCHGGICVTNRILELLLNNGCRLAQPGEFTKRAYLNGRIDLTQAESISDIISSESEKSRKLALNNIRGLLSKKIKDIRNLILGLMADIEVNIDYPEYEDVPQIKKDNIIPKLDNIAIKLKKLLEESRDGQTIKNGLNISIIGKPNVGKSSILNFLLDENKAIVTDIAGTTRDIVEGKITLKGILLNLTDTAGIRQTTNIVEKLGVEKSVEVTQNSDLIILVLNNNEKLTDEDCEVIKLIKDKKHITFINKTDLTKKIDEEGLTNIVYGNTISVNGLDELKNKIIELFNLGALEDKDMSYLTNARGISLVKKSLEAIEISQEDVNKDIPIDVLVINIKEAYDLLGEITGEVYKDELLDELFSKFCLGK